MNIDIELENYLKSDQKLTYDFSKAEPGEVRLCSLDELKPGVVWVSPESGDGYFEIPAVSLTNYCEAYDPEYILLWLPNEQVYGAWDCDHWELIIFEDASWADIARDPVSYINAQWDGRSPLAKKIIPTNGYELKQGVPF